MTTGRRIKLPKGMTVSKDGKVIKRPIVLSRPAEYARRKKRTWRAAK